MPTALTRCHDARSTARRTCLPLPLAEDFLNSPSVRADRGQPRMWKRKTALHPADHLPLRYLTLAQYKHCDIITEGVNLIDITTTLRR